jgi:hypothetical protein
MKANWKVAALASIIVILLILLFVPVASTERIILAPDPSSINETTVLSSGELSYVSVRQTGSATLAYAWFGVGFSPYADSYDCSVAEFTCSYAPTSSYPDVTIFPSTVLAPPEVEVSQIHVTQNVTEPTSLVTSFVVTNNGGDIIGVYIYLNETSSASEGPIISPGESQNCTFSVYPPTAPSPGDHYFLKIITSAVTLIMYVEVEG